MATDLHHDSITRAQRVPEGAEPTDIEPRVELAALRAEVARSRLILGSATEDAIVSLSMSGRVTSWNAGARNIFGYRSEEILGSSGEFFFVPEDRADGAFVREMCLALENGRAANERWHLRRDGSRFWASGAMLPMLDDDGRPHGFLNILRDRTAARAEVEHGALLLAEMGHRLKNTLATVQAVAAQTLRHAPTTAAFAEAFRARLGALARSHDVLMAGGMDGAPLREVVERTLEPYGEPTTRVGVEGPPVRLAAGPVVTLSLACHELATNAAKYGALSVPEGTVSVAWTLQPPPDRRRDAGPRLEIVWRERGGPPVTPPERRGFGSRLLEQGLARELGGTVALDFAPQGLECRIALPLTPETTVA